MNRPFNVTRQSYNLDISNEWLFSSKKEEYNENCYELSFVLGGRIDINCGNSIENIIIDLYGEDKDSGVSNVFWSYKDEVYDFIYYINPEDSYYSDEVKNLLYNFDYFFKEGESKAIKTFKKNMATKSLPHKFYLDKNITKNEFKAELTRTLRNIIDEIEIITNNVLEDLKGENEATNHVNSKKTILINKFNKYISEVNTLADLLYNKITKSLKKT